MTFDLISNKEFDIHVVIRICKFKYARNVLVKRTVLSGCSFMGLYARRPIKEGEIVCAYVGDILTTKEALHLSNKDYLMRLGEQRYVDSKPYTGVAARYINDCINPAGWNIEFQKRPRQGYALVVAIRDINRGQELFGSYGKWYWLGARKTIKPVRLSFMDVQRLILKSSESDGHVDC